MLRDDIMDGFIGTILIHVHLIFLAYGWKKLIEVVAKLLIQTSRLIFESWQVNE
jgi:hypothetical protein